MARSNQWCFTLPNPDGLIDDLMENPKVQYLVYGEETSDSGLFHFQGVIHLTDRLRLTALKKLLPGAHFEVQRGSNDAAIAYCKKDACPDQIHEFGTPLAGKGARSDLLEVKAKLDANVSTMEIADAHFGSWVRYNKSFELYRSLKVPKRNLTDAPKVYVIVGATNLGKTHLARSLAEDAHWQTRPRSKDAGAWWSGYNGHKEIIIDEFYGWLPFDLLLRLCDKYPLTLETKGSQVECQASTIIFTSNGDPRNWYKNISSHWPAFERRVTSWIYFTGPRQYSEHSDAERFYTHFNVPAGSSINYVT